MKTGLLGNAVATAWLAGALLRTATPALATGPATAEDVAPAAAPVATSTQSLQPISSIPDFLPADSTASPARTDPPAAAVAPQSPTDRIPELWARGEAAFEAGRLEEALRLFTAALALDEQRARSWNYIGGAHYAQGDTARALREFRRALELDPGDARACNNLGTALERLGDLAGAEAAYLQAIRIEPDHASTHRNFGILQVRLGNLDAARRAWRRYLELAPAGRHAEELRRALAEAGEPPPGGHTPEPPEPAR